MVSELVESLHKDIVALHEVGAIDKITMGEFDVICPSWVRVSDARGQVDNGPMDKGPQMIL